MGDEENDVGLEGMQMMGIINALKTGNGKILFCPIISFSLF